MELENIVANTVYLKAREGKLRGGTPVGKQAAAETRQEGRCFIV